MNATPARIDRRTVLKWLVTATVALPLLDRASFGADAGGRRAKGYGPDPDVLRTYRPGELWPLTFTDAQRRTAVALCDTIIPADAESPSASSVGVVDFIDEWISAPYEPQGENFSYQLDRAVILEGFEWLDGEGTKRFGKTFADLDEVQRSTICDDICYVKTARTGFEQPATFFALYRDLTAGGFYTTPEGTKDLKYVGNIPMASFDGPPLEVLKHVGLA
ncbi:MAG: gluconate 2-dehydrogenase subunit 3 family protein [Verrucomicrobia bacterium]|nr:gluconate 2-dehydrogenase subunit 3 family protein [Verrucomicrobiota bacterium]